MSKVVVKLDDDDGPIVAEVDIPFSIRAFVDLVYDSQDDAWIVVVKGRAHGKDDG